MPLPLHKRWSRARQPLSASTVPPHVCVRVCLGVGGRCDSFKLGIGVTVFVAVWALAFFFFFFFFSVNGEAVMGRKEYI